MISFKLRFLRRLVHRTGVTSVLVDLYHASQVDISHLTGEGCCGHALPHLPPTSNYDVRSLRYVSKVFMLAVISTPARTKFAGKLKRTNQSVPVLISSARKFVTCISSVQPHLQAGSGRPTRATLQQRQSSISLSISFASKESQRSSSSTTASPITITERYFECNLACTSCTCNNDPAPPPSRGLLFVPVQWRTFSPSLPMHTRRRAG